MIDDYSTVTEVPGLGASCEQLSMLYTRYAYASQFCDGKDVLEVACGAGLGLGYLARKAKTVIGGDCTANLIAQARRHYGRRIPLLRLDAHVLPFRSLSFDVVLLYESIYYLAEPAGFIEECHRVLRKGGLLLVCTVNREWPEFNPSPFSTQYFSARELYELLETHRFHVQLYGSFRAVKTSMKDSIISFCRRAAVTFRLVPRTMKGKEFLKLVLCGPLSLLPPEVLDSMAPYHSPIPMAHNTPTSDFKVLFAVCQNC